MVIPLEVTSSRSNRHRTNPSENDSWLFLDCDERTPSNALFRSLQRVTIIGSRCWRRFSRTTKCMALLAMLVSGSIMLKSLGSSSSSWNQPELSSATTRTTIPSTKYNSIVSLSNAICSGAQPMPIDGSIIIGVTGKPPANTNHSTCYDNDRLFGSGGEEPAPKRMWRKNHHAPEKKNSHATTTTTAWYSITAPAEGTFRAWLDQDFFRIIDDDDGPDTSTAPSSRFELHVIVQDCCASSINDDDNAWKPVTVSPSSTLDNRHFVAHRKGEHFRVVMVHSYNPSTTPITMIPIQRRFALKVLFTPNDSRLYHPPKATSRCGVANPLVFLPEQPYRELIGSTVLLEPDDNDDAISNNNNNNTTSFEIVPNCWNASSIKDDDDRLFLPPTGAWYTLTTPSGVTKLLLRVALDYKESKQLERPAYLSVFETSECHELIPPVVMPQLPPGTNVSSPACVDGTYSWQHPVPADKVDDVDNKNDGGGGASTNPVGTVMWQSKPNTTYKILVHRPYGIFGIYVHVVA